MQAKAAHHSSQEEAEISIQPLFFPACRSLCHNQLVRSATPVRFFQPLTIYGNLPVNINNPEGEGISDSFNSVDAVGYHCCPRGLSYTVLFPISQCKR